MITLFPTVFSLFPEKVYTALNSLTALHYSAQMGHQAAVELLISFGANIEAGSELGRTTPLVKEVIDEI